MSLTRKLSKLKDSDLLKADDRWVDKTKYELLSEIDSQNRFKEANRLSTSERADLVLSNVMRRVLPSATKMIAAFLIIVMGSGVGYAAQASVPGQPLWPVKIGMEKAEITLTLSSVKVTEKHIEHVNERLNEITKIMQVEESEPDKIIKQSKAVKQAITHLEKDVTAADTSLKIVKEEAEPLEVVELAKKVTDATKEIGINLKEKKDVNTDAVINEALEDGEAITSKVQESMVNLAVEVYEEITGVVALGDDPDPIVVNSTTTMNMENVDQAEADAVKAVVEEIVAAEIDDLAIDINDAKEKVEIVGVTELNQAKQEVLAEDGIVEEADNIKDIPEEAGVILDEAKVLLEEGSLRDAIDKVTESKEINDKAEIVLDKVDEIAEESQEVEENTETPVEPIENIEIEASLIKEELEVEPTKLEEEVLE